MALNKLLDEISVIPGVTGSCIFDRNEGPLCTNSEANIATDVLIKVGSFLVRMCKMGKMNGLDLAGSHFRFDNCTVVSTPLGNESILLTICNTQANCSLVATTAAMLAADMEEQLERGWGAQEKQDGETVQAAGQVVQDAAPAEDLQEFFSVIEGALAEAIGPVAGMILQDTIVSWQKKGPARHSRLAELVDLLLDEVDEEGLAQEFKQGALAAIAAVR
ncbi:hypothetical protein JWJ90_17940 [Desulfobulbus rhabdoformis]|uniref:hypothetical protein n=1 Tax=Desulfobulbus rhabdoformis TaxID=34032 RepID=UPI00196467A8|nr:hypothetical protein [Desulfobulbus rhabdoformis]MBM9616154.1 hypothetical protein [Desulfobulbus rhabdoformis]